MNNKDLFVGGDLPEAANRSGSRASNHMPRQQLTPSKAAKPSPLITMVPKKPFKSKAMTPDQTDSEKVPQIEKASFLHFGVLRKRSKLWSEKQFASTPNRRAPSLPSSCPRYEGRVGSYGMILTP